MEPSDAPAARETPGSKRSRWIALAGFLLVSLSAGAIGGLATAGAVESWYPTLETPWFTPPSWLFAPVWTTLYVAMGVAAWRVWKQTGWRDGRVEMSLFGGQLVLNAGWSLLFFGLRAPGWALVEICLLWLAIGGTLVAFWRVDRWAGWLLAPYLAWVSFAGVLNAAIWWLN